MRNSFLFFIFFIIGIPKVMSQNPDVAASYIAREIQIILAQEYNKELSNSLPKFIEYAVENAIFYEATKTGTTKPSSFMYSFPTDVCNSSKNWGPIKLGRCRKKIALLRLTDKLVRSIPLTNTDYNAISAVKSRIVLKASSILRDINKELLKS
jgi:hypothetical protein